MLARNQATIEVFVNENQSIEGSPRLERVRDYDVEVAEQLGIDLVKFENRNVPARRSDRNQENQRTGHYLEQHIFRDMYTLQLQSTSPRSLELDFALRFLASVRGGRLQHPRHKAPCCDSFPMELYLANRSG